MSSLPPTPRPDWIKDFALFSVIVVEVLVGTGLGIALGLYLWKRQAFPWWVLLLTAPIGLAVSMYRVYLKYRSS